jgi:hypothetical protein
MSGEKSELEVLLEQLDELLDEGAPDADAALEIATVAGLATRLGGRGGALDRAQVWRAGPGEPLLQEALKALDLVAIVAAVETVSDGLAPEQEVDDALSDFDDAVAAAVWAGQGAGIRPAAAHVAKMVRQVPEAFASLAWDGRTMARTAEVAQDPSLYDYWFAVADAGEWADE